MSKDIVKETITNDIKVPNKELEILQKHFSHCFDKESNFDIEKFKKILLKSEIDFSKESYGLDWLGKSYARLLATDSATTLLKEDKEWNSRDENKNSENLLLKGDNLEVLKHLSNNYEEKIKMIYIDPPYNTGSDGFVYEDDRKFTSEELSELAGVDKDKAEKILKFTESKSNSHSAWLTFMYPRLYIAKQLLKDDGVIFISIDDNEVAQLRFLMDEIFGEENFISEFIWQKIYSPKNQNKYTTTDHEYILCYAKALEKIEKFNRLERTEKTNKHYNCDDNDGRGRYTKSDLTIDQGKGYTYDIKSGNKIYKLPDGKQWQFTEERMKSLILENRIYLPDDTSKRPRMKTYLADMDGIITKTILSYDEVGHTDGARKKLTELFEGKSVFGYPKPIDLIKRFLILATNSNENEIILDFFAGSGPTADAIMQLNTNNLGNRKFILVQIPQEIDKKKDKVAYDFVKNELKEENPTIFHITKERLVRAANKIKENNKDLTNIDFGFKIFETIPIWKNYNLDLDEFNPQTKLFNESKLNSEDIQTLLTTWKTYDNIPLTKDLVEVDLNDYTGYYFGNKLYLMDINFKTKNLKELLNKIDEDSEFNPTSIICFGYNFESKMLREISENVKNYNNKKGSEIDFVKRY
ncbi:MAG: site-specific DNA-methyltransferase [Nanoarchaeota archaeon]|nr:site-specific DNA-methyltransferase [Nanoarchaeota archaeon]